jgi:uncharacterized iron-regulated membrane protein
MKALRTFLFWMHLACGVTAGLVILVMSATGALLAFKPQISRAIDHDVRVVRPLPGQSRAGMHALLTRAVEFAPGARPTTVTVEADPSASVAVSLDQGGGTIYVDPYSARVLGQGSASTQAFFRSVENWHRWLAVTGDGRITARTITDACNFAFLALAVTGVFLWWPRKWLPQHLKVILWFKRTARGRARDFNWHNVIGFWCAPVLIVLTATGVIMSYTWANNLLYRAAGSPVPAARGREAGPGGPPGAGRGRADRGDRSASENQIPDGIDALWTRAEQQVREWRTITMRWPARGSAPVAFTIGEPSWNAFARSQLMLNAATGEIVSWEPYANNSLGQKMRQWARFAHTGELGGWPGQTLAAVACAGGVVLVVTGLALAVRRLIGWSVWKHVRRPASQAIDGPGVPTLSE